MSCAGLDELLYRLKIRGGRLLLDRHDARVNTRTSGELPRGRVKAQQQASTITVIQTTEPLA